jgi:hypothetical protein
VEREGRTNHTSYLDFMDQRQEAKRNKPESDTSVIPARWSDKFNTEKLNSSNQNTRNGVVWFYRVINLSIQVSEEVWEKEEKQGVENEENNSVTIKTESSTRLLPLSTSLAGPSLGFTLGGPFFDLTHSHLITLLLSSPGWW